MLLILVLLTSRLAMKIIWEKVCKSSLYCEIAMSLYWEPIYDATSHLEISPQMPALIDDRSIIALWPTHFVPPKHSRHFSAGTRSMGKSQKETDQRNSTGPSQGPVHKWSPVHCYFAVFADVHSFQDNSRPITGWRRTEWVSCYTSFLG